MKSKKYYQSYNLIQVLITIILTITIGYFVIYQDFFLVYVLFSVILLTICNIPMYYYFENKHLIIRKPFKKIIILPTHIKKVQTIPPFRYGVLGFLGFIGKTSDGCISLTSNPQNTLLIEAKCGRKYLISPQNIDDFLQYHHNLTLINSQKE